MPLSFASRQKLECERTLLFTNTCLSYPAVDSISQTQRWSRCAWRATSIACSGPRGEGGEKKAAFTAEEHSEVSDISELAQRCGPTRVRCVNPQPPLVPRTGCGSQRRWAPARSVRGPAGFVPEMQRFGETPGDGARSRRFDIFKNR